MLPNAGCALVLEVECGLISQRCTDEPHSQDVEGDGCGKVAQAQHLLQEEVGHQIYAHAACEQCYSRL